MAAAQDADALRRTAEGVHVVQHGGDWTGQISGFFFVPEREFAITLFTNSDAGGRLRAELLSDGWAFPRFAGLHDPPAAITPLPPARLAEYEGTYVNQTLEATGDFESTVVTLRGRDGLLRGRLERGGAGVDVTLASTETSTSCSSARAAALRRVASAPTSCAASMAASSGSVTEAGSMRIIRDAAPPPAGFVAPGSYYIEASTPLAAGSKRMSHPIDRHRFRLAGLLTAVLFGLLTGTGRAGAGQPVPPIGQTTALIVSATNAPLRVLADDGMEHLEYDLIITNVFSVPVTLLAVEVTAPDGRVLLRLEGDALTTNTQPVFGGPPIDAVPVSGTVATVIDLAVPPGEAPPRLGHRISYELPPDAPGRAVLSSHAIDGPELTTAIESLTVNAPTLMVDARAPLVIAPPFRGTGWLNGNGCCFARVQHRLVRLAVDGTRYAKPETFAIDWVQLRNGRLFEGDGSRNEQYFGYGAEILSAAEGTVVVVRDGMPEETPNQPTVAVHTLDDYPGNNVIVQIRPDVFAVYGHMQPGSLRVSVGDRVATGQVLGLMGNTGNTTAPHLHFGLQDRPDFLTSNSVPFVIDSYTRVGGIPSDEALEASLGPDALPVPIEGPAGPQSGTYPLYLSVVNFP